MPTDIVEQLETQVAAMQVSLCSKQKQMLDYFKSTPKTPTPSKESRVATPIKDLSFKTVADATKDVSLVETRGSSSVCTSSDSDLVHKNSLYRQCRHLYY